MKIFIIIDYNPYSSNSASANRILSLVEGLINLGVDVNFYFTNGYLSKDERYKFGSKGTHNEVNYFYLTRTLLNNIWRRRWQMYFWTNFSSVLLKFKLYWKLRDAKGVIWVVNETGILKSVLYLIKKNTNIKVFTEISEFPDIHKINKGNKFQKKLTDKRNRFFEKFFFENLNGLALMTKTLERFYNEFPNPKPKLLHLPMTVDLNRFHKSKNSLWIKNRPYIAFVGVMNNAKDGVDILLEAFNKIHFKFPEFKLYLIGSWNYDTPLHLDYIKKKSLEKKVIWLGELDRNLIPSILSNANLLVLPRPNSKQAQGGFPTKLGEYLASGVPVCATTVGEIPDYLIDNESVFFAIPGSTDSFADSMERALSNPELANKVGREGKRIAKTHFNKDIQALKLFEFLQSI
jgi:glycosyltransferase involved in cell wall biosynthesis